MRGAPAKKARMTGEKATHTVAERQESQTNPKQPHLDATSRRRVGQALGRFRCRFLNAGGPNAHGVLVGERPKLNAPVREGSQLRPRRDGRLDASHSTSLRGVVHINQNGRTLSTHVLRSSVRVRMRLSSEPLIMPRRGVEQASVIKATHRRIKNLEAFVFMLERSAAKHPAYGLSYSPSLRSQMLRKRIGLL